MFYISGYKNNLYGVTDTRDKVVEWYTLEKIKDIVSKGLPIRGLSKHGVPYCKDESVTDTFIKAVKPQLMKLKLLGVTQKSELIDEVYNLAYNMGLINRKSEFAIDLTAETLILSGIVNIVVKYGGQAQVLIEPIDIRSKNVSDLARLGEKAIDYMYIMVDNIKVPLRDVINELKKIVLGNSGYCASRSTSKNLITYIGITPSNSMLKVIFDNFGYTCVSAKVSPIEYIVANADKITGAKVETLYGFTDYINTRVRRKSDYKWGISKMTVKKDKYTSVSQLKKKYPTLHDVYNNLQSTGYI